MPLSFNSTGANNNNNINNNINGATNTNTNTNNNNNTLSYADALIIGSNSFKIPPRAEKPISNPGGLFGDVAIPASLPDMPVLTGKSAVNYNAWKTQAKRYFQQYGLSDYVLKPSIASLQKAITDDQGNRTILSVRNLWFSTQKKIFAVIRTATEVKYGTAFFKVLEQKLKLN